MQGPLAQTQMHAFVVDGNHPMPLEGDPLTDRHPDHVRSGRQHCPSIGPLLPDTGQAQACQRPLLWVIRQIGHASRCTHCTGGVLKPIGPA